MLQNKRDSLKLFPSYKFCCTLTNLYISIRFTTFGDEALSFNFLKYGAPDPDLQRENDMSLKLRMSSVRYVHTKRFQTELVVFFQHFLQLQEVLGRMRAASEGNEVSRLLKHFEKYHTTHG